jgi:hypothetical protein
VQQIQTLLVTSALLEHFQSTKVKFLFQFVHFVQLVPFQQQSVQMQVHSVNNVLLVPISLIQAPQVANFVQLEPIPLPWVQTQSPLV